MDKEAVEAAKSAIEGGTFRVAQAAANDAASIKTWLANTLNVLFGQSYGVQFRAATTTGDVTVTVITPAIAGTETNPDGANGSFAFTVSLTRGATTLTATVPTGVIVATPHATIPVKRIEALYLGNLHVRIINTGNVATGDLTLALSGTDADVFMLLQATINSLAAGGEAYITLIPSANHAAGTYTATLTVSGDGIAETVAITYIVTVTGIESPESTKLYAVSTGSGLQVHRLVPGETIVIYNISGQLVYNGRASAPEQHVSLGVRGVYVVVSGNQRVKAVY